MVGTVYMQARTWRAFVYLCGPPFPRGTRCLIVKHETMNHIPSANVPGSVKAEFLVDDGAARCNLARPWVTPEIRRNLCSKNPTSRKRAR